MNGSGPFEGGVKYRGRIRKKALEIQDSVAIVTGASRGIGRATAVMLAEAGAKVVLNARKESEALLQVRKELDTTRSHIAAGDVGDFEASRSIVGSAIERFGRVDVLVNNAGTFGLRRTVDMRPDDWEAMFKVHVFGAFNMIRHVLPGMLERKRGAIVNIASFIAARPPGPGRVHYASAKAALFGLTRALGLEVAREGVRVIGIAPGLTDTDMVRQGLPNPAERVAQVPLGRFGRPEEIAHAVRFAIENDFLTAETLFVSGGE